MAMKMIKAWIAAVLALAMVLGMAGCAGKEPTAKELMDGVPEIDPEKYYDMTVEMDITAKVDGQHSDLSLSFGAEGNGDVVHLYDMDMTLGISSISIAFSMEAWVEQGSYSTYVRMTMLDEDSGWMLFSMDSDTLPVAPFQEIVGDMDSLGKTGAELTLEPHEKGEDFVVTWAENDVDMSSFSGAFSDLFSRFAADGQTAGTDPHDTGNITVQAHFDEETHDLKSVRIETDANSSGSDAAACVTIVFHAVNGEQELSIPQSVIDTAMDVSGRLG